MKRSRMFPVLLGLSCAILLTMSCRLRTTQGESSSAKSDDPPNPNRLILTGIDVRCMGCHGLSNFEEKRVWLKDKLLAQTKATKRCLDESAAGGARVQLETCLLDDEASPEARARRRSKHTGMYRGYYGSSAIKALFESAYPEVKVRKKLHDALQANVMPNPADTLSDDEALDYINWLIGAEGEAFINGLQPADLERPPPGPTTCTEDVVSDDLQRHIAAQDGSQRGWWARKLLVDEATPIRLFGCPPERTAAEKGHFRASSACFTDATRFPSANQYANPGVADKHINIKVLRSLPEVSSYWMRASPDGYFVGVGGGEDKPSYIEDLGTPDRRIRMDAEWDPGFAPDNQWFSWHSPLNAPDGLVLCKMDHLRSQPPISAVVMNPTAGFCKYSPSSGPSLVNEYQSMGASINGGRYYIVQGSYQNDDGGIGDGRRRSDGIVAPGPKELRVYSFDGSRVEKERGIPLMSEGDWSLSPSTELVVGRFPEPNSINHSGYRIRRLFRQQGEQGIEEVAAQDVGTICSFERSGEVRFGAAKANFSLDERFLASHRYNNEESADIYLYDLLTRSPYRLTRMPPQHFALYPVFRADGWIYFIVRDYTDPKAPKETIMATDAAVQLMEPRAGH